MEPRPGQHTIENDADIFLFIGRAVLSSPRIKFVQSKDARRTNRSVGAIGLIALQSPTVRRNAPLKARFAKSKQLTLQDRLTSGGIEWKIAKEVAVQFGSEAALVAAFSTCSSDVAKQSLLHPILQNMGERVKCSGCRRHWSKAIHLVLAATSDVRTTKRHSYQDILTKVGRNVCDPAVLLCHVYTEETADAGLNAALDSHATTAAEDSRSVTIRISGAFGPCFDMPKESSFYSLQVTNGENPWSLPCCQLSTSSGRFYSDKVVVFLLEGSQLIEETTATIQSNNNISLLDEARRLATKWKNLCQLDNGNQEACRRILLVRGLGPALEKAAKDASYREETTVVCDMIFAALMVEHNIVVLEAVRKKQEETTMILRQLALACFHFQLLAHCKG
eukprot:Sro143_g066530.2  (392) ;mRNA; r:31409-32584